MSAGKALKESGFQFDVAHTSVLTRAQKTLAAILDGIGQSDLSVEKSWRLNERHYGGLTGLNKSETAAKYGEEQVTLSCPCQCSLYYKIERLCCHHLYVMFSVYLILLSPSTSRFKSGVVALTFHHLQWNLTTLTTKIL